jgi:uncharacterized protein (TIGR02145 family)
MEKGTFIDDRDGKKYITVMIGKQTWMAENLNYGVKGSLCYGNEPANCQKYGRLYDWNTAMKACPAGWHLPSDAEWTALTNFVGSNAGTRLKSASGWNSGGNGTDDFGFSALPGGLGYSNGYFSTVGNYGGWWSSTEYNTSGAWRRGIYYNFAYVSRYDYDKTFFLSVRCAQD